MVHEIAALAFIVAKMDVDEPGPFELIIVQLTQCVADPHIQRAIKKHVGVDVSSMAIADHEQSLREDVERLRHSTEVPGYIAVSGFIYDVHQGLVREVIAPAALAS